MVGYTLRQERERQELSVNDIEQGTSIRVVYIEAIESGEYDKLPGEIYTKGFIKNYAKFLGMDPDAAVKEFNDDMAELKAEQDAEAAKAVESQSAENVEVKPVIPIKPERKPLGHSIEDVSSSSSSKLVVAAVVIIAALAGFAWTWLSGPSDVAKVDTPVKKVEQVETVAAEPVQPVEPEKPAEVAAPQSDVVNIQARFNDRCWTLVTVDGTVVQEGIIEGGQTLSWEGKEQISFRLGNAGVVEFFQNGQSVGVLGAEGDIADKTFTRQ